jgi:hypothetical protein
MIEARKMAVGGSGSVDRLDAFSSNSSSGRLRSLQATVRVAMEREAHEEVSAAVGLRQSRTVLTGYARYLDRGGKPEFFGITRTTSDLDDLTPARTERKYVFAIHGRPFEPTVQGLMVAIDKLLTDSATWKVRPSLSMIVCLRLAREHLSRTGIDFGPVV